MSESFALKIIWRIGAIVVLSILMWRLDALLGILMGLR